MPTVDLAELRKKKQKSKKPATPQVSDSALLRAGKKFADLFGTPKKKKGK